MITDSFSLKTLLFSAGEALFMSIQAEVVKWVSSCCKPFPRELNLALAAVLNVLGGDPELMNHPGGCRRGPRNLCQSQRLCLNNFFVILHMLVSEPLHVFAFCCVAAANQKGFSKYVHLYLGP